MAFPVESARQSVQTVVEQRLEVEWVFGGELRTPIQFPNVLGLRDVDGQTIEKPPPESPWMQVDIIWGASTEATFGTIALNENAALIQLSLYVPRNQGNWLLNHLVGCAARIFDRFHGQGLRCRSSSLGPDLPAAGYLSGIVRTPFVFFTEAGNQF